MSQLNYTASTLYDAKTFAAPLERVIHFAGGWLFLGCNYCRFACACLAYLSRDGSAVYCESRKPWRWPVHRYAV